MARFEALITPVADGSELRGELEQIAQLWGGALTWLDRRNASIDLVSAGMPVKLLLELQGGDALGILVTSREGMGAGAPQSQKLLDQLLKALLERMPKARMAFRSDRDGPIRQVNEGAIKRHIAIAGPAAPIDQQLQRASFAAWSRSSPQLFPSRFSQDSCRAQAPSPCRGKTQRALTAAELRQSLRAQGVHHERLARHANGSCDYSSESRNRTCL